MSVQTNNKGQIQPRAAAPGGQISPAEQHQRTLVSALQKMGPEIARALPKHITPDRMARVCLTALRTTPKLASCTQESFLGAILACAQLGLEPNSPLGHAYLVPYEDYKRKVTTCQLIIGYQGMIELAYRSGRVTSVAAHVVRQGDHFVYELGLRPKLEHRPSEDADREQRPITHAYAVAQIKDGEPISWVLSFPQIEARRNRGASGRKYGNGDRVKTPWDTDYEAMALKSAVRALFKWIPKSPELANAEQIEDASENGRLSIDVPSIREGLVGQGIPVPDSIDVTASSSSTGFDPETGEVAAPREPGASDEADPADAGVVS